MNILDWVILDGGVYRSPLVKQFMHLIVEPNAVFELIINNDRYQIPWDFMSPILLKSLPSPFKIITVHKNILVSSSTILKYFCTRLAIIDHQLSYLVL